MTVQEKDGLIYCPLKDAWHKITPEERVRQSWVCRLVETYGYSLNQMAQELCVTNTNKANGEARGNGAARADIVVWKSAQDMEEKKSALIVIELKAENVKIHEEDYYQGLNYAAWTRAKFFVVSNEKETKFFSVNSAYIPQKLQEIIAIPTQQESINDEKVSALLNKTKTFSREEFTNVLHTCHNIIRNNDKMNPTDAFDEISKILFIKIRFENQARGTKVFTREEYRQQAKYYEENVRKGLKAKGIDQSYMQNIFDTTKVEFSSDQLFEENDCIKIRESSFEQILGKLENYNLSDTQDDVKGIAFEGFLGRTFRGELGQYFTPRTIVDFMTEIIDPYEGETICDPCCGSGGFLIKAFEYVREKIEADIKSAKDALRKQLDSSSKIDAMQQLLNGELDTAQNDSEVKGGVESRMHRLSHKCIYGTDADSRLARTSKMNMIMHGDGHGGVHRHDGLLNVNGIFEEHFDVILTNPPFGSRVDKELKITESDKFNDKTLIEKYTALYGKQYTKALSQINGNIGKSVIDLYEMGKFSGLTEVLFMERCLRLLKKGGRMGIVLPEGVLNNFNLAKVREWFEGRAKIVLIVSIPQDVFISAGASVKPSLVFLKRFTQKEEVKYAECVKQARDEKRTEKKPRIDALVAEKERLSQSKQRADKARVREINKELNAIEKQHHRGGKAAHKRAV